MKNGIFILISMLLSFILLACQNEDNEIEQPVGELCVVISSDADNGVLVKQDTLFTESDIKSFNITTGELILKNITVDDIEEKMKDSSFILKFYIGETQLFNTVSVVSKYSSAVYNDMSFVLVDSKSCLLNGYPSLDLISYNKDEHKQKRDENILKNQKSWNILIKHLEEKGVIEK